MFKKLNIVLFEPEIPENTGNIARTCVGFNATLHLIRPYGFFLYNKKFIRSGLDYWKDVQLVEHNCFDDFINSIDPNADLYFITRYGKKTTGEIKFNYDKQTYLIFGKESTGIDKDILKKNISRTYRIPTSANVRSLNLSNCAAMLAYDYVKHNQFDNLAKDEPHKKDVL